MLLQQKQDQAKTQETGTESQPVENIVSNQWMISRILTKQSQIKAWVPDSRGHTESRISLFRTINAGPTAM